jgi:hypothetical protein
MRLVEAILWTAVITFGVFFGLRLNAAFTDQWPPDPQACTVERVNATTSRSWCE